MFLYFDKLRNTTKIHDNFESSHSQFDLMIQRQGK